MSEIERRLSAADPAKRRFFEAQRRRYLGRLRQLDRQIAACIGSVPAPRRKLVTDHDAFGYFADRYGIEVVGAVIPSQTTQAQPSAKDLGRAGADDRSGGGERDLPGELAEPEGRRGDRPPDRRLDRPHALRRHARPGGLGGATYLGMEAANADAMARGFTDGRRGCRVADRGRGPRGRLRRPAGDLAGSASPSAPGERMALLGPNGGGKTTLLRALLGELRPMRGALTRRAPAARPSRRPSARGSTTRSPPSTWRRWGRSRGCPGGGARVAPTASSPARRSSGSASGRWPGRPSASSPAASASGC